MTCCCVCASDSRIYHPLNTWKYDLRKPHFLARHDQQCSSTKVNVKWIQVLGLIKSWGEHRHITYHETIRKQYVNFWIWMRLCRIMTMKQKQNPTDLKIDIFNCRISTQSERTIIIITIYKVVCCSFGCFNSYYYLSYSQSHSNYQIL